MASPQRENGYTAIANSLLEALTRVRFPGNARQVFDVVLRKTYGYNKKADMIPLSQFEDMTGLEHRIVCRALAWLKAANLIQRDKRGMTMIVKDFDAWRLSTGEGGVTKSSLTKSVAASDKNMLLPVTKSSHSKDSSQKTVSKDRRPTASPGDNTTELMAEAKTYRSDDERWPDLIDRLKALGYYARIDGDVAGFFDGEWKVKGGQGWVKFAGSVRTGLSFVKRR